jgi:RecA/RadA recombinase
MNLKMAKNSKEKSTNGKHASFNELNDALSRISPGGAIIEDSIYAKIDEWIPTGSYILNAAMSGSLFGGMPNRRSLMFAGQESTGKTYLALSIVRNAQAMDYFPIYYDTEGSIDIDFVKRLGIDPTKFRIENIGTVEEFTTLAAKLNETINDIRNAGKVPPKIMVVLDSLGSLSSTKEKADAVSGSEKRDMTKQQAIRKTFRVLNNDFAKNGIPFIINNHVYAGIGSFIPGDVISGGGGGKYSPSIIFVLTKSKLTDKDSEEHVKKIGIEAAKVGIVVTLHPYKQRFARPIKVQIHIPFYKRPNPYVGLEKFTNWQTCGVVRGKMLTEKEYSKLTPIEQKKCFEFENKEGKKAYAMPRDTARTLVCKHLGGEVPLPELYTDKVYTEDVLKQLDDNIIRKTFELPSIESLEDIAQATDDLMDRKIEMDDTDVESDSNIDNLVSPNEE